MIFPQHRSVILELKYEWLYHAQYDSSIQGKYAWMVFWTIKNHVTSSVFPWSSQTLDVAVDTALQD